MAKKIKAVVKLQIPAAAANPAPPVGPALGQHGTNIAEFCKQFNEKTKTYDAGMTVPAVITIYDDRSFSFVLKAPPVSALLKKYAGLAKASGKTGHEVVGKITRSQVEEIARTKLKDLNTADVSRAIKIVEGTAKSMGIEIIEK